MNRRDVMAPAAGLALLAAASPAAAQQAAQPGGIGTLDRIIRDKKIRVTAEVTSPPFGILGRDGQPDGSEISTARQLAWARADLLSLAGRTHEARAAYSAARALERNSVLRGYLDDRLAALG